MDAILGWFSPTRWLILAAMLASLTAGYFGWRHHEQGIGEARGRAAIQAKWDADRDQWKAALAKQKLEAVQTLAAETAKVAQLQQRLGEFLITQEKTDANHEAVVTGLQHRLAGVRLRDPYAAPARCGAGSGSAQAATGPVAADRPADTAGTGGLISVQLSDLLRAKLRRADDINDAYASCRATAVNDRAQQALKP